MCHCNKILLDYVVLSIKWPRRFAYSQMQIRLLMTNRQIITLRRCALSLQLILWFANWEIKYFEARPDLPSQARASPPEDWRYRVSESFGKIFLILYLPQNFTSTFDAEPKWTKTEMELIHTPPARFPAMNRMSTKSKSIHPPPWISPL